MKFLSRTEEMILLSIWRLRENAYAVTIRDELKNYSGKTWAFGALFVMLDRLTQKGLVESSLSDPTPERGGRSKRMYRLTPSALDALQEIRTLQNSMWQNLPDLTADNLI